MSQPDKEHFVGDKTVFLHFENRSEPTTVTFPSSIGLHKAVKMAKGELEDKMFDVWRGADRFSFNTKDIQAIIFPKSELNRKSSKVFIDLTVAFKNGLKFSVIVANVERMRIIYKQLEPLVGVSIFEYDKWLVIPQEQNKFAYIKYLSDISYISSKVLED